MLSFNLLSARFILASNKNEATQYTHWKKTADDRNSSDEEQRPNVDFHCQTYSFSNLKKISMEIVPKKNDNLHMDAVEKMIIYHWKLNS